MPVLEWIEKRAVESHHLEVPYRILRGEAGSGNLLVEGDNLERPAMLLQTHTQHKDGCGGEGASARHSESNAYCGACTSSRVYRCEAGDTQRNKEYGDQQQSYVLRQRSHRCDPF